jgi:hypothetical protein
VHYAPDTDHRTVRRLERLAKRYGDDVILAPYPGLERGVALTAWGRLQLQPRYDERRAGEFVERLRNRYVHGWARPDDCPAANERTGGYRPAGGVGRATAAPRAPG